MKKLLTLALVFCAGLTASAQFTEGQDVTQLLGVKAADSGPEDGEVKTATNEGRIWQGFDYTQSEKKNDNDYPKYEYLSYDFHTWGIYGVDVWDVYQELENVPSGIYTMSLEALYRGGQLGTVIAKYDAGMPVKNTKIYVQIGDQVFEEYVKDICVGRFKGQTTEDGTPTGLYVASDGAWGSDEQNGNWFYPVSHAGFSAYLDTQCDGVSYDNPGNVSMYHNAIQFIVPTDGTKVRIGIKHETPIAEDSSAWDHWRIFYDYAYDEEGLAKVAYAKYEPVWNAMDAFYQETLKNYPALGELMGDELMEIEQTVDETDADAIYAAIDALNAVEAKYLEALITIKSMDYLVAVSQSLIECENRYAECDKEALKTAIENAETAINATLGEAGIESIEDYITAAKALYQARVDYIWSGEIHTGADGTAWRDVSGIVACSGLVNEKYTPFYNEAGEYVYPQEIEETWYRYHPQDGANTEIETPCINNNVKIEDHPELNGDETMQPLANEAKWSYDVTDVNRWVYDGTSFKGAVTPAATTYKWYKGYSAHYGGWTANPNDGELKFFQTITNLPEGYYSVEGRMISNKGQGSASDIKQYLFIQGVNEDGSVDEESKYNKQNETNWGSYTRQDWEIGETDMIKLSAGQNLVIGYSQNCEAADGGVILKFYGTDVNFSKLTEEAKQKVVTLFEQNKDNFKMGGDVPAVQALLDQVKPESVSDDPGFKDAKAILAEATDFINAAAAYNFNTQADYLSLQEQYTSQKEASILGVAAAYVDGLAESETATYKDGQAADAMYKAYASYMKVFDKAEKLGTDEINGILAQQAANLTTYCDDASVLAGFEMDLNSPIYNAIFAKLGTENATEENPVEITEILANPSFENSPSDGWTSETAPSVNTFGRGQAEIWNAQPFDLHQSFNGLPAGKYELRVRAIYRDADASAIGTAYSNFWTTAGGDYDAWETGNAYLYANNGKKEVSTRIKSVVDQKFDAPAFTYYWNVYGEEGYEDLPKTDWSSTTCLYDFEEDQINDFIKSEEGQYKVVMDEETAGVKEDGAAGEDAFDKFVEVDGTKYYFPSSMGGFYYRTKADKNIYNNSIRFDLPTGNDLSLGIKKTATINGDWLIMDDFQLFYLGELDESTPEPNDEYNLIADDESFNFNAAEAVAEAMWPGGPNKYRVGKWEMTWNTNNGAATVGVEEPGYNKSAKALKLSNTKKGGNAFDAQLSYVLSAPLAKGKSFVAKFYAKADQETEFQFGAEATWEENVTKNQFGETVQLTTEWKEYALPFTVEDLEDTEAIKYQDFSELKLNFGFLEGNAYIDQIRVYELVEEPEVEGNFITDLESYNFNNAKRDDSVPAWQGGGNCVGNWKMTWNTNNNTAFIDVAAPGYESSAQCLTLTNPSKAGVNYSAQASYVLAADKQLQLGQTYVATFYAKADQNTTFDFGAEPTYQDGVSKWQFSETVNLTTEWQKFTIEIEVPEAMDGAAVVYEPLTELKLNFGFMEGVAYVDRIVILDKATYDGIVTPTASKNLDAKMFNLNGQSVKGDAKLVKFGKNGNILVK